MGKGKYVFELGKMIGKQWMYNTVVYHFRDVSMDEDSGYPVHIYTDKKTLELVNEHALELFISDCMEVEQEQKAVVKVEDQQSLQIMTSLQTVIMENIDKVREDSGYIPQAQAISKQVQTLINLTNAQLALLKSANKV